MGEQDYSVTTTRFADDGERRGRRAAHRAGRSRAAVRAASPGTERELPAQLVLLAMGFLHPEQELLDQLGVEQRPARQRQGA